MQVDTRRDGTVAVVRFSNPPVNVLSIANGTLDALSQALTGVLADPAVQAVVIASDGRMFSAGADINDFDLHADTLQRMRALTSDLIEGAGKPIVAAIHGMALGGGLELALACHYRICSVDAGLGLPEVTMGVLPGGGGTQRLPRLVGVARALDMMLGAKPVSASEALRIGLVDQIAQSDLLAEAIAWARDLKAVVRTSDRPVADDFGDALVEAGKRAARSRLSDAPAHIVTCAAAAASEPFDRGMAIEADLFEQLRCSESSRGLRHAFAARRKVAQIPGLPSDLGVLPIETVAVIGAGTMGVGIALALLAAGLAVTLIDAKAEALDAAQARVAGTLDGDVAKGRLTAEAATERLGRLALAPAIEAAADADLVIEAVFEDLAVKKAVFTTLDRVCKPSAILASNTSTLDVDAIAAFTDRPQSVIGMHFFSPANIMRLLEVVRGEKTAPSVLATVMALARRIGKVGVVAGVCDGFIGNRIFEEYLRQAYFLLEEGALPAQVDAAMERWGMAMGPLRVMDLAGQDIGWSIRKRRAVEQPDRPYSKIPDRICEMGRFGQKTGAGFYRYADGRTAQIDPEIDALIVAHSAEIGVVRREIDDREIVDRCLLAMANEGAKIVAEGIAYRPLDIDVIYLDGYGFPAERGGPMFQADVIGLDQMLTKMRSFAAGRHGWAWEVAPLLADFAGRGERLASLN